MFRTEGVLDGGEDVECGFVRVFRGRLGGGYVEVEEIIFCRCVHEGTQDE